RALALIVTWWSVFTSATAFAWNAVSMTIIRFLFGMAEAGAFPIATRSLSHWMLPPSASELKKPDPRRGKVWPVERSERGSQQGCVSLRRGAVSQRGIHARADRSNNLRGTR